MKNKIVILILLLVLSSLLISCGYKDIDKRFFVVALGIDLNEENEEKPYKITISLAVPSTKIEPKSAITQIETIEAVNISDGLRQIKTKLDKELDLGHCKVLIIGQSLANENITDFVHWIGRRRDVQNIASLAIGSPSANEIVSVKPESDRFPGNTLNFFFSSDTTQSSYTYLTTFTDIFKRIEEPGLDPILPIISVENDDTYIVNSLALLDKERVKLILSPRETQLFNQLSEHLSDMTVYGSFEFNKTTVTLKDIRTKYKIHSLGFTPEINMTIKNKIVLEEIPASEKINNTINYDQLVSDLENQFSKEAKELFEKIRDEQLDPYGFGLRYRAKHPLTVEQFSEVWPQIYEQVSFNINTSMDLISTGLVR